MAIFHLSIQVITRGKGKSAVAAAAYRAGERITNVYDNYTHDYTKKKGIIDTQIFLPDHAPAGYCDRATLWNAVEKIETNSNSQLAREIELSLPVELSMEQNIALVHEYVKKHFVTHDMIADVCVHDTGKGNPHAHIMLTLRPMGREGEWGAKSYKEYILNDKGERIRLPSGAWKSRKVCTVDWNDKNKAEEWRKGWADTVNAALEREGLKERIDHRSYERQDNGLIPTIHLGVAASQMEQKGIHTEKGNYNRQAAITNSEIKQTKARIRKVKNWLYAIPLTNAPSLMDIMGGVAKGKDLDRQWQRIKNLQTSAKVLSFLTDHGISNVEDFAAAVEKMHYRLKDVTEDIQKAERRLEILAVHLAHVQNNRQHKSVYQKYKSLAPKTDTAAINSLNPFTKDKAVKDYEAAVKKQEAYYTKHVDKIQAYQAAQEYFTAVMNGRTQLPVKDWQKEQNELLSKRYALCDEFYSLKEEIKSTEVIRKSIENLMHDEKQRAQPDLTQHKAI